ncbi:hypothetical protein [Pontivivens ytuae]|uniref:Uncharacterized protein n=1 Tax=Pontivivens ytuae TaxID=2789856 RepID=A0A7S9LU72_9RHOB|nr:hypothetical protein [Pontivivens ytuae]QPH55243.1 hypothetical protein I0K15_05740 [Pontivivens ytuae]
MLRAVLLSVAVLSAPATLAQDASEPPTVEEAMTVPRLAEILIALDPEARGNGSAFELTIAELPVTIFTDAGADRMRAMIPIRSAEGMSREELERAMQANFDTALDARYAVANGRLWAVYIHPLSPLEKDQLISGLGQLANIALTYGNEYSGGALAFGGGDSARMQRERIEELLRRGRDI